MALTLQPLYARAFFLSVTAFWGTWIVLGTILRFLTSPRKFLYAKDYNTLPGCALNSALGSHKSVTIKSADGGGVGKQVTTTIDRKSVV